MSESLNTLRRQNSEESGISEKKPSKKQFSSLSFARFLPWLLLAAFVVLAWWLFGHRFERGREVELVKVVTVRAQGSASQKVEAEAAVALEGGQNFEGPTLFQASGWVEPDPLMLRATALYSGVVDVVHVLEGERVEKGQLLATMVDDDAKLDLQTAQAALGEAKAAYLSHEAQCQAAEAFLVSKKREVSAAHARLEELVDESNRLSDIGPTGVSEGSIKQAALRVKSQKAVVESAEAKEDEAEAALRSSRSSLKLAEAVVQRADAELGRRQLALERTRILSPVDGRIQRLFAAPGKKRILAMDDPESATIATLYQPDKLQARIDVPLEEAAQLVIGQPVRLRSTLLSDRIFKGRVTRIDGQADLQRNTLQAKVQILDPADQLRPEMLCRAEFLSSGQGSGMGSGGSSASSGRVALYVPESAIILERDQSIVWALDASGERIEQREMRLSQERREEHVRVLEGLRPGDVVVNNPSADLEAGERVIGTKVKD
ncbi:MAG: efflux RND transporter periplasmic adaptor subunit [Opitutales bacterium]